MCVQWEKQDQHIKKNFVLEGLAAGYCFIIIIFYLEISEEKLNHKKLYSDKLK